MANMTPWLHFESCVPRTTAPSICSHHAFFQAVTCLKKVKATAKANYGVWRGDWTSPKCYACDCSVGTCKMSPVKGATTFINRHPAFTDTVVAWEAVFPTRAAATNATKERKGPNAVTTFDAGLRATLKKAAGFGGVLAFSTPFGEPGDAKAALVDGRTAVGNLFAVSGDLGVQPVPYAVVPHLSNPIAADAGCTGPTATRVPEGGKALLHTQYDANGNDAGMKRTGVYRSEPFVLGAGTISWQAAGSGGVVQLIEAATGIVLLRSRRGTPVLKVLSELMKPARWCSWDAHRQSRAVSACAWWPLPFAGRKSSRRVIVKSV